VKEEAMTKPGMTKNQLARIESLLTSGEATRAIAEATGFTVEQVQITRSALGLAKTKPELQAADRRRLDTWLSRAESTEPVEAPDAESKPEKELIAPLSSDQPKPNPRKPRTTRKKPNA
jgi:hypothetical protein